MCHAAVSTPGGDPGTAAVASLTFEHVAECGQRCGETRRVELS